MNLLKLASLAACAALVGACADNLTLPGRSLPTTIYIETSVGDTLANVPFLAVQEGDTPWRALNGLTGEYSFLSLTGRFGTLVVCPSISPTSPQKVLLQHTTYLDTDYVQAFCAGPSAAPTPRKLTGTISGLTAGDAVVLVLGDGSTRLFTASGPTLAFDLADAPSGLYDILAAKGTADAVVGVRPNRILFRRNVDVSHDATLDLDFSRAAPPETFAVNAIGALGSETTNCSVDYFGAFGILPLAGASAASLASVPGIPANVQAADEFHFAICAASTETTLRTAERFFKAPGGLSLSLPEVFSTPSMSVEATAPYVRLRARFSGVPMNAWVNFEASQEAVDTLPRTVWNVSLSPTWLQQTPSASADRTFVFPAFSGLEGWSDTYGLQPARATRWSVGWEISTEGNTIAEGAAIRSTKRGTLTP